MSARYAPHIVFVFLDGVGLAGADPAHNPFAALDLPAFARLAGGNAWTAAAEPITRPDHVFRGIDACLGLEGLPQSGTGQASLFTGRNCVALAGRHYGPYPHSTSRPVLASDNVFLQVGARFRGRHEPAAFVNAYPPRFFAHARARDRWTVTTRSCLDADLRIRDVDDVRRGEALTAELTGRAWREMLALDVPEITPEEAGRRLVALSEGHAFTLFEYFLTDKAGHSQSWEKAGAVLADVDRFFAGLLERLDPTRHLLLVTSDHGNLEDLSTKTHTRNPVPLIALGPGAALFSDAADLTDVLPTLLRAFD